MTERATSTRVKASSTAEYLAALEPDKRRALERLRRDILAVAKGAEDIFSYQMPAFRYQGKVLVWMGAAAHHCAFYPGAIPADLAADLADYETSKGTIRFTPDKPLPAALVKKLVEARIAKIAAASPAKKAVATSKKAPVAKKAVATAKKKAPVAKKAAPTPKTVAKKAVATPKKKAPPKAR